MTADTVSAVHSGSALHELPDLLAISGRRYAESTAISKQLGNRRGSEATIEQLKLVGGDESRMWHAARAAQRSYELRTDGLHRAEVG